MPAMAVAAMLVTACAQETTGPRVRGGLAEAPESGQQAHEPSLRIAPPDAAPPRAPRVPASYNSVHTSRRVIALTFDDGPHPELTPKLLDLLRAQGVRATFYVVGRNVEAHPDIARRIVAEGHEIANHSWSHPALTSLGAARLQQEIGNTSNAIESATGRRPTSMRPPYGAINERVRRTILKDYGMDVVLWSVDPFDWKRPGASVVANRLVEGAKPGGILLAHDIHPGTIEAMPETIARLKEQGYAFVTVSQLLALQEPVEPKPAEPKPSPPATPAPQQASIR